MKSRQSATSTTPDKWPVQVGRNGQNIKMTKQGSKEVSALFKQHLMKMVGHSKSSQESEDNWE